VIPRLGDEGQGGWLSHMRGDNHAIPIWATTVSEFTHPCMQVHRDEMSDGQGCNHLPRPIITPACHSVSHVYSTRSRISRKTRHQCGPRSTRIPASKQPSGVFIRLTQWVTVLAKVLRARDFWEDGARCSPISCERGRGGFGRRCRRRCCCGL
jgi:hypothetical protein